MEPPFYRPSFSKHLFSLARSNYFARGLDADDRQFLEYVKRHGCANGNLPNMGVATLEELEFWHFPYSVQPGIERRVGKRPREEESQEARSLRQARSNAWHARRIIRENEKAIAAAELAREQKEWEAAQAKRKLRQLISDHEWETAAPGDRIWRSWRQRKSKSGCAERPSSRKPAKLLTASVGWSARGSVSPAIRLTILSSPFLDCLKAARKAMSGLASR